MSKVYGNLINRFEEGRNFNADKLIHVGDDVTKYWYSDRTCYYVTDVINQKDIKVKRYYTCADHSKPAGMGHQNWLYFKTKAEYNKYINSVFTEREKLDENPKEEDETEIVYRYNKWMIKNIYKKEDLDSENMFGVPLRDFLFTDKEIKKLEDGKEVYKYSDFGNISFGIKSYYYDWTF